MIYFTFSSDSGRGKLGVHRDALICNMIVYGGRGAWYKLISRERSGLRGCDLDSNSSTLFQPWCTMTSGPQQFPCCVGLENGVRLSKLIGLVRYGGVVRELS